VVILMYNSPAAVSAASAGALGGLAATGLNVIWLLLAAFALLGAGMALMRLVPRREA
jgi:4-hydroxybenzoate polyprenyltransferase